MTDVHGTSRALGFQLSGRRFRARRAGGSLRGTWDGGDGGAGPRWRLWRAAILSRREKDFCASAHWGRSDFRFWLALSASDHVTGGLPESVPLDYAHEIARAQGRRPNRGRRDCGDARGADLHDRWGRRTAGGGSGNGRYLAGNTLCAGTLRTFRR